MTHTEDEWSRWGRGQPTRAQHWSALDVTKDPPVQVVLSPAGATEPIPGDVCTRPVNERTRRGDFVCLVPDCGPFVSAVAGTRRRHHFRHAAEPPSGRPGHEPESIDHLTAKATLAAWLRRHLGEHVCKLVCDEHPVLTPTGLVEPDVYVELDTGARIAVEYQHSPGDLQTVLDKHRGYARAGIADWWLFAPFARTCVVVGPGRRPPDVRVQLTSVQAALIRQRVDIHWFDVEHERVGTPLVVGRRKVFARPGERWDAPDTWTARSYPQRPWPTVREVLINGCSLFDCRVDLAHGRLISTVDALIDRKAKESDAEICELRKEAQARADKLRDEELSVDRSPGVWIGQPAAKVDPSAQAVDLTAPTVPTAASGPSRPARSGSTLTRLLAFLRRRLAGRD